MMERDRRLTGSLRGQSVRYTPSSWLPDSFVAHQIYGRRTLSRQKSSRQTAFGAPKVSLEHRCDLYGNYMVSSHFVLHACKFIIKPGLCQW